MHARLLTADSTATTASFSLRVYSRLSIALYSALPMRCTVLRSCSVIARMAMVRSCFSSLVSS